uniref:Thromboxane-A synthase n=1 Tax=Magallana gigas TaxID=29159 RepID=A0A8W8NWF2_MAGGI
MDEIVGNSILFLLVGYDNTSNALAFTAYNLATHPDCQEKLIDKNRRHSGKGYTVPEGTDISFPMYSIHRDPRFWENPTRFDPERFTPENKAKRHPYAYLPFGNGTRSCIGMRLAQVEVRLAIVSILQHYRFKTCEETEVSKKLDP